MKRVLVALLAGSAVFTIAFASAAALNVRGDVIQAGVTDNVTCDEDGVDVNYGLETDTDTVNFIRISDISGACAGADMWISVNGDPAVGPESIITNQVIFDIPDRGAASLTSVKVWIEG